MKHSFIPLFLMLVVYGNAQQILVPATTAFDKKWIHNDSSRFDWYILADTMQRKIGEIITRTRISNDRILVITQVELKGRPGTWIDSTLAEQKTGKPIYHSSYNAQRNMVLEFGNTINGYYYDKQKDSTIKIADPVKSAYFDSNIYPQLIGWLPLKEGYRQDIAIYDFNPKNKSGVLGASVKNVASGAVETKLSGKREVWIVTVTDEISSGSTTTYYFDKKDRRLWKQEIQSASNKILLLRQE